MGIRFCPYEDWMPRTGRRYGLNVNQRHILVYLGRAKVEFLKYRSSGPRDRGCVSYVEDSIGYLDCDC